MSLGAEYKKMADELFSLFGSDGFLFIPKAGETYSPNTGDTSAAYDKYPIKYVPYSLKTDATSDFGLSALKEGKVTFYINDTNVVVNETCYIEGINGLKWGISELSTIFVNDLIITYEASIKAHL